ncbi:MAG: endonuclease III, partial [Planctomycetota bacterium]|nr:endonuclease III [Planctomycetota bacterium]
MVTSRSAAREKERRERALRIVEGLALAYPVAECALRHESPFQLLAATILSAQCTDERVNQVTPELFRRFPTPQALADAE